MESCIQLLNFEVATLNLKVESMDGKLINTSHLLQNKTTSVIEL
jgi:hypothetical protein